MDTSFNLAVNKVLTEAAKRKASHVHLAVGSLPVLRVDDALVELPDYEIISDNLLHQLSDEWLSDEQVQALEQQKEITIVRETHKQLRAKVLFFYQKGHLSVSLKLIPQGVVPLQTLGLPKSVLQLTQENSGLIIIAGPYNSGKSTTLTAFIEAINQQKNKHIITIENPIEHVFANQHGFIEQREVGRDVISVAEGVAAAVNSDTDILVLGQSPDQENIESVLEFASSGRFCILVMEDITAQRVIESIVDLFPASEQKRAFSQLAQCLKAVVVQRLVPAIGGGSKLACEILIGTPAVQSLIKEGKVGQLTTVMYSSRPEGMTTLDQSLADLVRAEEVMPDKAKLFVIDQDQFSSLVRL
jgi:twitching motility protein PilT